MGGETPILIASFLAQSSQFSTVNQLIIRSDGTLKRDYCYVKDVVHAYTTLAERLEEKHLGGEAFNFTNGNQISVVAMTKKILALMGR
jgi:CDP-glucose 4,6-dehydratase